MSGSNVTFDCSGLRVKLVNNQEDSGVMSLEGDIITYAELYTDIEKEIIVDGYHREKDFVCDFVEEKCRALVGTTSGETSIREIISIDPAYGELEKIVYTSVEIASSLSRSEPGKIITEGDLCVKMICQGRISKDAETQIFSLRRQVPFRISAAMPQLKGDEIINEKIHVKDIWCERINGKQIEFNACTVLNAEVMEEKPFKVLVNPAFEESKIKKRQVPMVVYVTGKDESLWAIAKKFKTTTDTIMQLNHLDDQPLQEGKKLLILK